MWSRIRPKYHQYGRLCGLRKFSSLYSPMFPQRAVPDLPDVDTGKKGPSDDDDFLSRHGGKVALAGFVTAVGLIYRWIKNGSNKNAAESEIRASFYVDPKEISEIRHNNLIDLELYTAIIQDSAAEFPDGRASYASFINYVQKKIEAAGLKPIEYAHILDRMILPNMCTTETSVANSELLPSDVRIEETEDKSQLKGDEDDSLPLHLFLVAFNVAVRERADRRLKSLFQIASTRVNATDADSDSTSCTGEALLLVLQDLIGTFQIPPEKLVIETGTAWPFRTFRRKTPSELLKESISAFEATEIKGVKRNIDLKNIDEAAFRTLLEGSAICVWGMFLSVPTSREGIEEAHKKHGAAAGGRACMQNEDIAATESIESGLYVTWSPLNINDLPSTASDELKSGTSQCCRVRSAAACLCGHPLFSHVAVPTTSRSSFIKPPKCASGKCTCRGFQYIPDRPEECGQWWLPRRKDFNIADWRKRVKHNPADYVCIGCDLKVSDHETLFETRAMRVRRSAPVDEFYRPLMGFSDREEVLIPAGPQSSKLIRPRPDV